LDDWIGGNHVSDALGTGAGEVDGTLMNRSGF
jgi:hypothetical protein